MAIDRKDFVRDRDKQNPYGDHPLAIGHGQTISQPTTVAFMLEKLAVKEGNKVLDVGSGSGWTTALLAKLVGKKGKVIGAEKIDELVAFGRRNLEKYDLPQASIEKAHDKVIGAPENAPYDRILVSAESNSVPQPLLDQLKSDGRLVIPVNGSIEVIDKASDGSLTTETYPGFVFVPLV